MENKYLIGLGAIALGIFAYSRYAKKDDLGQGEDSNTGGGGGGIGGGGFMPNLDTGTIPRIPPTNPVVTARVGVTPTSRGTVVVAAPTTQMNNPIQSGITRSGVSGTGIKTGGITGAGTGTGTGTTSGGSGSGSGTGTRFGSVTGAPVRTGLATQLFSGGYGNLDGSAMNCKTPIYLNDLVRSWNRP